MTLKLLSFALFLSFLICYLEWGTENGGFIFQLEYSFLTDGKDVAGSFAHPLILLPFLGQLLLLITLFMKRPHKKLVLAGMLLLSPLVLMIMLAGALSLNYKMVLSTLPFIVISVLIIRVYKKWRSG